jgi:hypothetical protein
MALAFCGNEDVESPVQNLPGFTTLKSTAVPGVHPEVSNNFKPYLELAVTGSSNKNY